MEYTLLCMLLFILLHAALDIDFNAGIILVICGLITGQLTDARRSFGCKPFAAAVLAASALFVCYSCAEYAVRSRFESAYLKKNFSERRVEDKMYIIQKLLPGIGKESGVLAAELYYYNDGKKIKANANRVSDDSWMGYYAENYPFGPGGATTMQKNARRNLPCGNQQQQVVGVYTLCYVAAFERHFAMPYDDRLQL